MASGPVSFGRVYSMLNEVLRRGGTFRNGACVLHLDITHPDILEFVTAPRHELPWVKRCVNLNESAWLGSSVEVRQAILQGIKKRAQIGTASSAEADSRAIMVGPLAALGAACIP